ncbi:MAG: hypothetical protein ACRDE7_09125 [Sphingobacterium sp.]
MTEFKFGVQPKLNPEIQRYVFWNGDGTAYNEVDPPQLFTLC